MPACIVELGFMNSPTDNQLFDANVENYAKAIGDAVLKTYEAYGKDGADATESVEDVPGTEEQISTETGEGTTGQVLQNTQIEMFLHWMPPVMTGDLAAIPMMKTVR